VAAGLGQCVEERVGRRVPGLRAAAPGGGDRGEQHELLHAEVRGQLVQMARAHGLGRGNRGELGRRGIGQQGGLPEARGVQDRAQRRSVRGDPGQQARGLIPVRGVTGDDLDAGTRGRN
jgi:hypothetical protein